ncbi:MAG: hypothetical protein AB8B81_17315 [Halioglobus sp.]
MAKPNYSFEKRQKELAKKKKKEEKRLRKAGGNKPEDFDSGVVADTSAADAVAEGELPANS